MPPDEGGTKIQRRNSPPPAQQQMMTGGGFGNNVPQQMDPRMIQEQMMMQQQYEQQLPPQAQQQPVYLPPQPQFVPKRSILKKNPLDNFSADVPLIKNTVLVSIIFILLNSKFIWKQILQFPFMGNLEPSMVGLLVNSILAGIMFYLISNYLIN